MSAALPSAARELRILVAEPSRTLAALIRAALAELGAEIEQAPDGAQALQLAKQRTPDLLIADQGLPGLDGYALAHALKQLAGAKKVATLLLVPEYATPDPERLAYVGIQDVLAKPFERAVLLERARSLLGLPDRAPPTHRGGHELAPAPTAFAGGAVAPLGPLSPRPRHGDEPPPHRLERAQPDAGTLGELEERLATRLATLVNERLPVLVDGGLARLLPTSVLAATERVVAERVPAAVEGAAQRALAEVATPTRVAKVVAEVALQAVERAVGEGLEPLVKAAVDAAVGRAVTEAAREIRARVEGELLARLDRFVKEELTVRLNAHAEQIVWKVVPAIAEDLVKEEIKRLTTE